MSKDASNIEIIKRKFEINCDIIGVNYRDMEHICFDGDELRANDQVTIYSFDGGKYVSYFVERGAKRLGTVFESEDSVLKDLTRKAAHYAAFERYKRDPNGVNYWGFDSPIYVYQRRLLGKINKDWEAELTESHKKAMF